MYWSQEEVEALRTRTHALLLDGADQDAPQDPRQALLDSTRAHGQAVRGCPPHAAANRAQAADAQQQAQAVQAQVKQLENLLASLHTRSAGWCHAQKGHRLR